MRRTSEAFRHPSVKSRCMSQPTTVASTEILRSRQNARLKDLRQRLLHPGSASDGLIAIEGEHLVQEAARSGLRIHAIFVREDWIERVGAWKQGMPPISVVAADAFNHACATESPQGIAAVVEAPQWSFKMLLDAANPLLVVLAGLQDPGNVGAIVRTAEAFGATGILLLPGTVTPWNQKVLRASAGSVFRLPTVQLEDASLLTKLRDRGIALYACATHGGISMEASDLRKPAALVIGNEGAGIADSVLALCSGALHIPCPGPVESLNAAVAASILLYEASRQRGHASMQGQP